MTKLASFKKAIDASPLLPGTRPVELHYRDGGRGVPIVLLHGGWGYGFYPHDDAIAKLDRRFLVPDRTGYGGSPHIAELPPKFHVAAAIETEKLLDALGIERSVLWGHSDGAVIATILALRRPERYDGIIVEAIHLDREKPRSRAFFRQMLNDPDAFGERVIRKLADEHGEDYWRTIIRAGGRAWLDFAATPKEDFYEHRLHELRVPMLVVHGADDPRTEPGELDRIRREVPTARIEMIEGGGHSPHSTRATASRVTAIVDGFVASLSGSDADYTLFHRIGEPGSARIRLRVVELGLKPRIDFQNAETDGKDKLALLGGSGTPALWDGRTLATGEAAVGQKLAVMATLAAACRRV
ncbi:MAG: alpha/beta hydrolase [Chloroflexota bacterium]|nr:alpha/beta hydrolase [Chloroflexota bacterium]